MAIKNDNEPRRGFIRNAVVGGLSSSSQQKKTKPTKRAIVLLIVTFRNASVIIYCVYAFAINFYHTERLLERCAGDDHQYTGRTGPLASPRPRGRHYGVLGWQRRPDDDNEIVAAATFLPSPPRPNAATPAAAAASTNRRKNDTNEGELFLRTNNAATTMSASGIVIAPLELVHIRKTGGTAIAHAAALVDITWGVCHYWTTIAGGGRAGCQPKQQPLGNFTTTTAKARPGWRGLNETTTRHKDRESSSSSSSSPLLPPWHIPPSWLRHDDDDDGSSDYGDSPYTNQNKTLFAIVRNPYERFISEYYCPHNGLNPVVVDHDPVGTMETATVLLAQQAMDKSLSSTMKRERKKKTKQRGRKAAVPETPASLNVFLQERLRNLAKWTVAYVPQSDYIFDIRTGDRLVEHVLKYENLAEEFHELMQQYGLPVVLPDHAPATTPPQNDSNDYNGATNDDPLSPASTTMTTAKGARMTVRDLAPDTIRRINDVARADLTNFGYTMLDPDAVAVEQDRFRQIQRIYYINLSHQVDRRTAMEDWLSRQPIPYERIDARVGLFSGDVANCVVGKQSPLRCRGLSGLVLTQLDILQRYNATTAMSGGGGLTIVLEDDFIVTRPLQKVVDATLAVVPADWDVIRWDCWGQVPDSFDLIVPRKPKVFRTVHRRKCTTKKRHCWFAGGTHAMLWRPEGVAKLERLWSQTPYDDIDGLLTTATLNSYCVNMGIGKFTNYNDSSIPKFE
jgi:hypothetical protein